MFPHDDPIHEPTQSLHGLIQTGYTIVPLLWVVLLTSNMQAAEPLTARVPPVLEIEVIDPGVDARGNPAVVLNELEGGTLVDIPPTVLVHRYYYTGKRSFRGPNLPGGPSIVVASHPRTGKRVYVPVQLLPGSPMVHYTHHSIEYDYGDAGVTVMFPYLGQPRTKVRTGRKMTSRVADALHLDQIRKAKASVVKGRVSPSKRMAIAAEGVLLTAHDAIKPLTQPAEQLLRLVPGVVALTDPTTEIEMAQRVQAHNAETKRNLREYRTRLDDLDQKTIR